MNKIYMLIFAAGSFIFASCGGETKTETQEETTTQEAAPATTETAPAATETVAADTTK